MLPRYFKYICWHWFSHFRQSFRSCFYNRGSIWKGSKECHVICTYGDQWYCVKYLYHYVLSFLMICASDRNSALHNDCMFISTVFAYGQTSSGKTYTMVLNISYVNCFFCLVGNLCIKRLDMISKVVNLQLIFLNFHDYRTLKGISL